MNKKGFTLVELLAVIAILAILVVIAMPNVLGMFNSSKKNTFITETQNILKQVATDYVEDSMGYASSGYFYTNVSDAESTVAGAQKDALNIETGKKYVIQVDTQGNITLAQIWDTSYCYNNNESPVKYNQVKDQADSKITEEGACTYNKTAATE